MAISIPNIPGLIVNDVDEDVGYMRVLAYGGSGAGKTHFLATIAQVPQLCPVLVVDFDYGTQTIRNMDLSTASKDNIRIIHVDSYATWNNVKKLIWHESNPFRTVAFDDMAEMYDLFMRQRLKIMAAKREEGIPFQEDWMRCVYEIRKLLRLIRSRPIHVFATTTERVVADEMTTQLERLPSMPGQMAGELPKYFSCVLYLNALGSGKYNARTAVGKGIRAKNRGRKLPEILENPTAKVIYDSLIGDGVLPSVAATIAETIEDDTEPEITPKEPKGGDIPVPHTPTQAELLDPNL